MRGRLEQQKQSAPFAQRQAMSRLELQLHEANVKFQSLERTIADKNLEVNTKHCTYLINIILFTMQPSLTFS